MIANIQGLFGAQAFAACAALIVVGPMILIIVTIIYNLYINPLRKFPGPKSSAATPIPYLRALLSGNLSYYCFKLHEEYGDVVRIAPRELSYACAAAWKDIHGPRPGHQLLPKDKNFYTHPPNGVPSIITAGHKEHPHLRRLLAHAFSEKALRDQEPLMKVYVDLLIQRLREKAENAEPVDMVQWYNWTTFDIIGDLTFGEPFDCLKDSTYHPWIEILLRSIQSAAFLGAAKMFPGAQTIMENFLPKGAKGGQSRAAHQSITEEKVKKRLERVTDRADLMQSILKQKDDAERPMTLAEIMSTSSALIVAGSETTATLLSGATYHLLQSPEKLQNLISEVRSTFKSEEEINMVSVQSLKYMLAVLDEGLRMYPPVPIGLPRTVPEGGEVILSTFVPAGTTVSVNQWASYHSPRHFRDPESFIPERFLGDPRFAEDDRKVLQPFSTGVRNCIGRNLAYAEMRLIMARLIWNFDMEMVGDGKNWLDQRMYTLWDKDPLNVRLSLVSR